MSSGRRQWKRSGPVLFTALVLGATVAGATGDGYQSGQGTKLYAVDRPALEDVRLRLDGSAMRQGLPLDEVRVEAGQLKGTQGLASLSGFDFIGVVFSAANAPMPVTFRIRQAWPHRNVYTGSQSATAWDYWVEWESQGSSGDLCPGGVPALAMPGRWSDGLYISTDMGVFSFACQPHRKLNENGESVLVRGGVTAKCVDWGYPPWTSTDRLADGRDGLALPLVESVRHHVACVAMASADYCGGSMPNTVHDTPIVMFDNQNVETELVPSKPQTPFVADGPFGKEHGSYFEAAWTAGDSTDARGNRGHRARALCLTKKRWSTLPLNGACGGITQTVKDPREVRNETKYCDDMSAAELQWKGALLYSYSTYIDAGLYRFLKTGTTDQFVTTTVRITADPYPQAYQPEGVMYPAAYTLIGYEGVLLSRNAPGDFLKQLSTEPLQLYTDGQGYASVSNPAWVPQGFQLAPSSEALVGHVSSVPAPWAVPELHLWQKQGRYATSTHDLAGQGFVDLGKMSPLPTMRDYARMQP
jgi:hypothetical protein